MLLLTHDTRLFKQFSKCFCVFALQPKTKYIGRPTQRKKVAIKIFDTWFSSFRRKKEVMILSLSTHWLSVSSLFFLQYGGPKLWISILFLRDQTWSITEKFVSVRGASEIIYQLLTRNNFWVIQPWCWRKVVL